MGIESSRESASANVEKKPDIITLLKQHLPNASVESFSALKPEKQRAVEILISSDFLKKSSQFLLFSKF